MTTSPLNRRGFLGATALTALGTATATKSFASPEPAAAGSEDFIYEVVRTEEEWRARLTEDEYSVMREAKTEAKFSSPFVEETRDGIYCCKGCDLTLYESLWKVPLDIGWVFFRHSMPNAVLTDTDGNPYEDGMDLRNIVLMEAHCRRCGSHLGHIVNPSGELVHCINGSALTFRTVAA